MRNRFESPRPQPERLGRQVERREQVSPEARIRASADLPDWTGGIRNVELSRINPTDIQSANDFRSPEQYTGMHRDAQMLQQMQPELERGATADTFDSWDRANQIGHYSPEGHVRGYQDVYHSYHGSEAVALESRPDGTYDVINGRHRIVAARDAGLKTIPARVVS